MQKTSIIAALVLLLISLVAAEEWMRFTTEDGLADDFCRCIAVDHDGNVWVGSADYFWGTGGVSMWDGETWTTYHTWSTDFALRSNCINDIAVDSENNIWFATGDVLFPGGLTKFDGETWERFDLDTLVPDGIEIEYWADNVEVGQDIYTTLSSTWLVVIRDDTTYFFRDEITLSAFNTIKLIEGSLYICGRNGIMLFDGLSFSSLYSDIADIFCMEIFNDIIYAGSWGAGLFAFDSSTIVNYDTSDGLCHMKVYSLLAHGDSLWFVTRGGVNILDSFGIMDLSTYPGAPSSSSDIARDSNDNFYFACRGLYVFNRNEIVWGIKEKKPKAKYDNFCWPNPNYGVVFFNESESRKEIYDIKGSKIAKISAGQNSWTPDKDLPSGVYLVIQKSEEVTQMQKINLVR